MCFSNLPVEFDENGDPYLADDADDVARPGENGRAGEGGGEGAGNCGCSTEGDVALDAAPEEAYDAILSAVPETTRSQITSATRPDADSDLDSHQDRDSAEDD